MARGRFYIERRTGPMEYHPIGLQPAVGFASVWEARDWLLERGQIRWGRGVHGEAVLEGWGGERGFYVRELPRPAFAGPAARPEPVLVRSLGEFEREFGAPPFQVGAYGSIMALEMVEWVSWPRRVARAVRARLRRS
jgi:hypothetical protein